MRSGKGTKEFRNSAATAVTKERKVQVEHQGDRRVQSTLTSSLSSIVKKGEERQSENRQGDVS